MNFYIIEGKLYAVCPDDLRGNGEGDASRAPLLTLLRFSSFAISEEEESYFRYELIKNRYNGLNLKFTSLQDFMEYTRFVHPGIQRHMGVIQLKSNADIRKFIENLYPSGEESL